MRGGRAPGMPASHAGGPEGQRRDRKSTRLNSSHPSISYAVFCLKKKKQYKDADELQKRIRTKYPALEMSWEADLRISRYRRTLFLNDPAPTEIYTLSLHDALPIPVLKVNA